jgi:hypothetical protein
MSPVKYELGFIYQKKAFFIFTAVKTSDLTQWESSFGAKLGRSIRKKPHHNL